MNCGTQIKPLSKLKKTWKPAKKCDRTELLQLHRPTSLSKLKNTIPRPKCRPIKDDLPFWEIRELNEKIPMYHGYVPSGRIVLHRGLMGNNFHKTNVKLNFSLSDPYCRDVSYAYNALHDPHLKHWSTSNKNRKFLQQQGLITEDMDVICSLKEYNEFRYYLWRVHNDLILQQLKLEEEKKVERKKILDANLNHQNEMLKKLKRLKYAMSKKELKNVSKPFIMKFLLNITYTFKTFYYTDVNIQK